MTPDARLVPWLLGGRMVILNLLRVILVIFIFFQVFFLGECYHLAEDYLFLLHNLVKVICLKNTFKLYFGSGSGFCFPLVKIHEKRCNRNVWRGLGNSERWITGCLVGVSFRHDFTAPENGMKTPVDQYSGGLK